MITPEGTGAAGGKAPKGRGGSIGVAALVVVGGLIAVGILTSPDPAAVEETTTSTVEEVATPIDFEQFTVEQIATGEPLDWGLSMAIDDRHPLALVEHDGTLYLFTGSETPGSPDSGGLRVWRSGDGANWEGLGEVIPAGHRITTVDSTMQGLVATSTRLEDNALVLWESADSIEWAESEIPTGTEDPYLVDVASVAAADEATLVVASKSRYDRERLLEERLMATGTEVDLSDLSWQLRWLGAEGHQLDVMGPFGIPVLQAPIDSLGLSVEEQHELTSELFDPLGTDVWVRNERHEWETGFIGDARSVDSIVVTPDGRLVAYGQGAGRVAKVSDNGIDWETAMSAVRPVQAQRWGREFVGVINAPDLMISGDGESWQATGLAERFPDELQWAPIALGAGEGGAAMFIRGTRPLTTDPDEIGPVELVTDDGSTLVLEPEAGTFHLITEDHRYGWDLGGGATSDWNGIDVDLDRGIVDFRDRETGEILASVELAELQRADLKYRRDLFGEGGPLGVLAFTEDGVAWVIQDMTPDIGEHATIWLLEVTADRVVAVVRDTVDSLTRGGAPGLEVWSALVP